MKLSAASNGCSSSGKVERLAHQQNVSVVIPCYNEAQRLDVRLFRAYMEDSVTVRLIFVDDGSKDKTLNVLKEVCHGFEDRSSILPCKINRGKAEAVRLGLLHTLKEHNPKLIGFWDADLATPLAAIQRFVDVLNRLPAVDMVFGSRVRLLGRDIKRDYHRHYLGRVFATVVSNLLDLPIYDTQCGAKLFRVNSNVESILEQPFLSQWIFDVEIIARYLKVYNNDPRNLERKIYEYPLESWEDVAGSKIRPLDFIRAFADMLKIRSKYLKYMAVPDCNYAETSETIY